jgi:chemotaxis family two-component system response regulator Rcp1
MEEKPAAIEILLVEDNPGDARMMIETFKRGKVNTNISVVTDGTEAMSFLRKEGKYIKMPRPELILLDLRMPGKDGKVVLAEIKNDPCLKRIPVIVVAASDAEMDILESYNLHANSYIIKPIGLKRIRAVVESIENFWFTVAKLPPGD